jgi:uncharacterized protein (TIGR03790 family)
MHATEESAAARVVLLANSDDPDSLRIAQHYAEVRSVPADNVIALKLPLTETITWREFLVTLWQPLLERLIAARWIDATPMRLTDAIGRQKYAPNEHRIAALVLCRGVPLKIAHDPALFAETPPFTSRAPFRTNEGAVDAELSLLAQPNYPINAFVPNPLFQNDHPSAFDLAKVVKVARLDGPTASDAAALVDRAVAAERTGLLGRAYIDLSDRDPVGNEWLETTAKQISAIGFDATVDRAPATFPATARMDAPVLYFGWYAGDLNGPFALPGFRFPPGAIALHIHSYSAGTLRLTHSGWAGPLVARGVTATFGNVHEPYLTFTHRPDLLMRALARGETLGDAAYYALPALSWQAVLIGDPLYRPFAVSLEQQLQQLSSLPPQLAGYAVLRRMRQLEESGREADAKALAIAAQRQVPSLAVGLALAQRLQAKGEKEAAGSGLGFAAALTSFDANEWALAREAALVLTACDRASRALEIWRTLLASPTLPREVRIVWLPDARKTALAAKDFSQAIAWENELSALTTLAEKKVGRTFQSALRGPWERRLAGRDASPRRPDRRCVGDLDVSERRPYLDSTAANVPRSIRSFRRSCRRGRIRSLPSRSDRNRDRCPC